MDKSEMKQFNNVLNTLNLEGVITVTSKTENTLRFKSNGVNLLIPLNTTFDVALRKLTNSINFSRHV